MKILLLLIFAAMLEPLPDNLQQKLNDFSNATYTPNFKQVSDSISPDDKTRIISYLKHYVNDPTIETKLSQIHDLIELGDEETIAKELEKSYADVLHRSALFGSLQPKVITAIAPDLLPNEALRNISSIDAPIYPLSFTTAMAIREELARSPYFSKEVNQWAASWKDGEGDLERFREVMRNWWKANQRFFESGNYAAVQPGVPLPVVTPVPTVAPGSMTQEPSAPMDTPRLKPASTPAPSIAPVPAGPSLFSLVGVTILVLAIIIGIVYMIRKWA